MAEAYKHRTVAAPRVAEEVPVVVHHNGGGSHVPRRNHSSAKTGLSAAACCRRARSSSSSSSRRRERSCCSCLLPLFSRKRTRHFSALVLLVLAGTFSLRGWRAAMMIDSTALGAGRWSTSSPFGAAKDQRSQCEWESGGPIMFDLRRSKMHADAGDWFHAAECFIRRRQDFKEYFSGMDETDVYLKDSDAAWNSKLTPMTRLFVMAGLTSVGVRAVHFVDGNHATFSFPPPQSGKGEGKGNANGATMGWAALRGGDSHAAAPEPGQVGMLRLDDVGYRGQFVVSPDQPLPLRLTVSAPVPPARSWDGRGRSGSTGGGGGGGGSGGGDDAQKCVKFAGTVGDREQAQARPGWFPAEEDPRDLVRALDNFCPISWLRKEQQALSVDDGPVPPDGGDGSSGGGGGWERRRVSRGLYATVVGGPGRGAGGGLGFGAGVKKQVNAKSRKLVIYQREDGRQLLNTDELADELGDRLGHIGWKFTQIVHDDQRHPCELVEELAGADVLLTAYGFQSMLSIFMPPRSVLFEVYPHKYFKAGHAQLVQGLGHRYAFSESPPVLPLTSGAWPSKETCMKWFWCRWYVQRSDVIIDEEDFEVLISHMLESLRDR